MTKRKAPGAIKRRLIGNGLMALALLSTSPANAISAMGNWSNADIVLRRLPVSSHELTLSTIRGNTRNPLVGRGFTLFQNGSMDFKTTVIDLVRSHLSSPRVEIRATPMSSDFSLRTGTQSLDLGFYVGGVALCGFPGRAHALANGDLSILATLPAVDPNEPLPVSISEWPDLKLSFDKAATAVKADAGNVHQIRMLARTRCLYVNDGKLIPAWSMMLAADDLRYRAIGHADAVMATERAFFDVDGTASVYPKNVDEDDLTEVTLTDLTGDGTLTSTYLRTFVPASWGCTVQSDDNVFDYPVTSDCFPEVQAYAHAQTHLKFFTDLGYEWAGPKPLEVRVHVQPNGRKNNALFVPSTDGVASPTISIDDGDGKELQNLTTDGDVVSHEFGHHVLYKTLTSTDGQSLVLHEGLADTFAFLRTGDSCLGESICPLGGSACIMQGQCLRSAEIDIVYDDDLWNQWAGKSYKLGHLHGQLISGMIWDMRKRGEIPAEELTQLVFRAAYYFKANSGFCDLMDALFNADQELFAGQYLTTLKEAATRRGLTEFSEMAEADSCPANGNSALPSSSSTVGSESKKKDTKSDGNPFTCGVAGGAAVPFADAWPLALILLLPILVALQPERAKERAKSPNRPTKDGGKRK